MRSILGKPRKTRRSDLSKMAPPFLKQQNSRAWPHHARD
jgi:hypothetical protein